MLHMQVSDAREAPAYRVGVCWSFSLIVEGDSDVLRIAYAVFGTLAWVVMWLFKWMVAGGLLGLCGGTALRALE